ncbi:hypothetical protein JCM1393_06410 [Clostridium carnis]
MVKKLLYKLKTKGVKYLIKKIFYKTIRNPLMKIKWLLLDVVYRNKLTKEKYFIRELKLNKVNNFIDINGVKEYYKNNYIDKDNLILDSNKILLHKFNFLGMSGESLGENIDWNRDYVSNFTWENKYYKLIKIIDLNKNIDVKLPWELSRFQHLITLGKAFIVTKDEKYSDEFIQEIESWKIQNPYNMSVNWTCAMEVAIRAINLILAKEFFIYSNKISNIFWDEYNELLYKHGTYIWKNLENKGEVKSNHYISDLCGLLWLGIYFGEISDESRNWLLFAKENLEKEITEQVNYDGTTYEGSTSYHKLVTELYLYTVIYAKKNQIEFSVELNKKLEAMCNFLNNVSKDNYCIPFIGDNDDGRVIILSQYYSWNRKEVLYLLDIASYLYEILLKDNVSTEECHIIWGRKERTKVTKKDKEMLEYDKGGYFILRNKEVYCLIRAGELSFRGQGGHSHNEQLSFELSIFNEDIFIDPGTYVYTSNYKMRNLYRSTFMHNTLNINGEEQNKFNEKSIFELRDRCKASGRLNGNIFFGSHSGYLEKYGAIHNREVKLLNRRIVIRDDIEIKEKRNIKNLEFEVNFILSKNHNIEQIKNYIEINVNGKIIKMTNSLSILPKIEEVNISPSYGVLTKSKRITYRFSESRSIEFNIEY